ncbi:hypothetical protein VSX61_08640 [Brenneria populi subsp. brevivirga]|uniref:hypothetical protein n=1 Tax=Brenneria populi TaxID=1505588 RepID=UPI002E1991BC|nr:hypothetical protein [Brenneria populi subsp. brevivirga]
MSLSCKRCGNQVDELDQAQATISQADDGTWGVDLILTCPYCAQAYGAFIPTGELEVLEETPS